MTRTPHPSAHDLALHAGGDLGAWSRWRVGRHLQNCPSCAAEAAAYRADRESLAHAASLLPPGVEWARLSSEMAANIRLGVEAGRLVSVAPEPRPERLSWQAIAALAGVLLLVSGGWFLDRPGRVQPVAVAAAPGVTLNATAAGVEVEQDGRRLTLSPAAPVSSPVLRSDPGSLRARYVDDTGQVTVLHVYSE